MKDRFFKLQGGIIAYTDYGDGQPVLLIHGSASSRRIWRPLAERLAPFHRVVAPDLFGYGETWSRPRDAEDIGIVHAAIEMLGRPVHLVGHSYGGALALQAALQYAPRLASLTLIEPVAFQLLRTPQDRQYYAEIEALASRHIELAQDGLLQACADLFMGYWIGHDAWVTMPNEARERIARTMPKVAVEWRTLARMPYALDICRRLHVRTLLVRGTRTVLPARRVVDRLLDALPDGDLVEIEGAGHMSPLTHGAAVAEAIQRHIESGRVEALFGDAAA